MSNGTHLAVMLGAPEQAPLWKQTLARDLEEWGVWLVPGGDGITVIEVNASRDCYGVAWLLDRDEARDRHPAAPFLSYRSSCPFLANLEPIGFVEWIEETGERTRSDWIVPLIKKGKGLIVGLAAARTRPAVVERSFSLANLGTKWGFEDGDVLLTRDLQALDGYRVHTGEAIMRTLAEHGIDMHVSGPGSTIHNPFRIGSPLRTAGREIDDDAEIMALLAPLTTSIWTYDFTLVDDRMLFP